MSNYRSEILKYVGVLYPYEANITIKGSRLFYETEFDSICIDFSVLDIGNIIKYVRPKNGGNIKRVFYSKSGKKIKEV